MATIFLAGAQGQVGTEIEFELLKKGHKVVSATHKTLDITDKATVLSAVEASKADLIINAAAYSNVEKSEEEIAQAYNVNAIGVRNLAKAALAQDIPLIHLSTDYVFYDEKHRPHAEDDSVNSECIYGKSKLEGETFVQNSGCKHIIVRISWIFGRYGSNFVKAMLSMAQEQQEIAVVCDQLGNPTPAQAVAECMVKLSDKLLETKDFDEWGIYHYCGQDAVTWDQFAHHIFEQALKLKAIPHEVSVVPITSDEFKSKAKRPVDSRMSCERIKKVFDIDQPAWQDFLPAVIESYQRQCDGKPPVDNYDANTSLINSILNDQDALEKLWSEQQEEKAKQETDSNDAKSEHDASSKDVLNAKSDAAKDSSTSKDAKSKDKKAKADKSEDASSDSKSTKAESKSDAKAADSKRSRGRSHSKDNKKSKK